MNEPSPIAEYSVTEAALAELAQRFKGATFEVATLQGMKDARKARAELRGYRTALESKRVEIKAPALQRCQLIDSEAKRITAALSALEDPIDAQIKAYEKRLEDERLAAARAEAERIAAEDRARKEAEERRLAEERAKIAAERQELERQKEAARKEREEADRQARLRIEEQERAARVAREEADRTAKQAREAEDARLKAEADRLRIERQRLEDQARAEQFAKDEAERAARLQEQIKRQAEENAANDARREAQRLAQDRMDARSMLVEFDKRFGHLQEFGFVLVAIRTYLEKNPERKAA